MSTVKSVCIFTIVSNNYLHYANTLFESVAEHCNDADLFLGLCDREISECPYPKVELLPLLELGIPNLGRFIYQYNILELNTAIKPYVIERLFQKGYRKVIYFDPDIKLFSSLDPMLSLLDRHNILLTPHLTGRLDDTSNPSELDILRSGTYNLGYLGLSTSEETDKLISWWKKKLYTQCIVDLPRGIFVDQKWMDLVPSLYEGVKVVRNEGWNVAYWNLSHRTIKKEGDLYLVNGVPLVFFHYSGFSSSESTLSKHQDRHTKTSEGPALIELCDSYSKSLRDQNISFYSKIPYAFAKFADGTTVPDQAGQVIRENIDLFDDMDFFDPGGTSEIFGVLNTRAKAGRHTQVLITRLVEALWKSRADLQSAFPDYADSDAIRYITWVLANAEKEANFSEAFLCDTRNSLERLHHNVDQSDHTGLFSSCKRRIVRAVWNRRELIPLRVRLRLGESVASWALSASYPKLGSSINQKPSLGTFGVNLIGYMEAESGVGEAARSTLRALAKSDIPYCVIDYRMGNISRMHHPVECEYVKKIQYPINIFHVNADQSKMAKDFLGSAIDGARYNIGYWYWEMQTFPQDFDFAFNEIDEIWVATKYVRDAIATRTSKPVHLIPPNIEIQGTKSTPSNALSLPEDKFVFFHMSDVLSMADRKNPTGVIRAFIAAFPENTDHESHLIIKISNLEKNRSLEDELNMLLSSRSDITLIPGYLSHDTLSDLMARIDCYVSLHRAEGFGLPIAEAMSLGKPVIATYWSGNVDFMNRDNSLPVDYELVSLETDVGPYKMGEKWAEPSIEDASDKMKAISHDLRLAQELGNRAREFIRTRYSVDQSVSAMAHRLSIIAEQMELECSNG